MQPATIENALSQGLLNKDSEKSFIDKVLGRKDIEDIREIMRKKRLTREDLLHLLYLMSATEAKLMNYGAWERYVTLKFYVWIRDFVSRLELLYDYHDFIEEISRAEKNNLSKVKLKGEKTGRQAVVPVNKRTIRMFENCMLLMEHNVKFLVDLYFNCTRTTLSVNAAAIKEILANQYEFTYSQPSMATKVEEHRNKRI